ncbi:FAD binding domain-containing protein [Schizophyllum fasciatum]
MTVRATEPPVLIVGAGVSGLILAILLAKNNVPLRIVERLPSGGRIGAKGSGVQPRTQELLEIMGIPYEELMASGMGSLDMRFYAPPDGLQPAKTFPLAERMPPNPTVPYPELVTVSQSNLEALLLRQLHKYGAKVEYSTTLQSLSQDEEKVVAVVMKDGAEEQIVANWLVGTDGARGSTRKLLGVNYVGESRPGDKIFIADVTVPGDFPRDYWHAWGQFHTSAVGLLPLGGGDPTHFQLHLMGPEIDFDTVKTPQDVKDHFYKISNRKDIVIEEVRWMTTWTANVRLADRMQVGRCILAGDAAHCHSPAGAQGMNTGLQDSFNLAWKLAAVVKGAASPALLASYEAERYPVISAMLQISNEMHSRLFAREAPKEGDAEPFHHPDSTHQLGVNYRHSTIVFDERYTQTGEAPAPYLRAGRLRAGDRAPDAPGADGTRLFSLLGVQRHVALLFLPKGADEGLLQAVKEAAEGSWAVVAVVPQGAAAPASSTTVFVDNGEGVALKAYEVEDTPLAFVVRPDAMIGAVLLSEEGVRRYVNLLREGRTPS